MKKSKIGWLCLVALLSILIFLFLLPPKIAAEVETITPTETPIASSEKQRAPTAKAPVIPQVLLDIAYAESHDNQDKIGLNYAYKTVTNEDGTTSKVRYVWSRDIGRFQINNYYNEADCKAAGFDIYTVEGNTGCALMLYNTQGTSPWNASKYCWSDITACKAKRGGDYN